MTKKERDRLEDDLENLERGSQYPSLETPAFTQSFNKPKFENGKSKYWVVGVAPQYLEYQATIIEMKIGWDMSYSQIANVMGYSKNGIIQIVKKYKPKQGDHEITMNIMSKV